MTHAILTVIYASPIVFLKSHHLSCS